MKFAIGILAAATVMLSGCGDLLGIACTAELRPNLVVQVVDEETGRPAALGAIGTARHRSGTITTLRGIDSTTMRGNWDRERSGEYTIHVRKPGYHVEEVRAVVRADKCHVQTLTVGAEIARNLDSELLTPLAADFGARFGGYEPQVGVLVKGDTLLLIGRSTTNCSDLEPVAHFYRTELHVQLQPSEWYPSDCRSASLQQFDIRYSIPAGATSLLVTSAYERTDQVELFNSTIAAP